MIDALGDRMKRYEEVSNGRLVQRMPAVIRVDGKAFHTFTRDYKKPFDDTIRDAMIGAAVGLIKNISGSCFAYTQSDEISVLCIDYKNLNSQGWFDYNIQKMVSVSSSLTTAYFNNILLKSRLEKKLDPSLAVFDARVYNVPREDVDNYFLWRQQDCVRNAISQTARAHYSHKMLDGVNTVEKIKLLAKAGVNYQQDIPLGYQQGWIVTKDSIGPAPFFQTNREFVDRYVNPQKYLVESDKTTDIVNTSAKESTNGPTVQPPANG